MNTEIKNTVYASDQKSQYDERAKRLLGHKIILAHILAKTVDEFQGMAPEDIVPFIEGDPLIGVVPIEPSLTNPERQTVWVRHTEPGSFLCKPSNIITKRA